MNRKALDCSSSHTRLACQVYEHIFGHASHFLFCSVEIEPSDTQSFLPKAFMRRDIKRVLLQQTEAQRFRIYSFVANPKTQEKLFICHSLRLKMQQKTRQPLDIQRVNLTSSTLNNQNSNTNPEQR